MQSGGGQGRDVGVGWGQDAEFVVWVMVGQERWEDGEGEEVGLGGGGGEAGMGIVRLEGGGLVVEV